ncbi:unnamed protein product [Thelazia callipaeda]|uniref:Rho-GAP domain-containing protein n=1 Tax=Thelazia callipaeda TaxID=103827 RepID=A0A0N5D5S6_THECL|nr:unnamed protein product [Thelazia callipaeda]
MDKYLDGLRSMRLYRQANTSLTTMGTLQFTLENVASYTMELDVGDRRGFSTFTLRGVPVFLVDAFNFLRLNGLNASGIFRKEGNIGRLRSFSIQTFFGSVVLPKDCTTHDVCSLIKRFFRELKVPLFAQMQRQLLDVACLFDGEQRITKILEAVRMLPAEHLATLTFLMRQLKYVSSFRIVNGMENPKYWILFGDRHESHQMTIENIACVFAPSLFRDDPSSHIKRKRESKEDLISNIRNENELRISIITDLIDNAHKIGVPRDYYLASRRPSDVSQKIFKGRFMGGTGIRSVSAKPSSRTAASSAVKVKPATRKEIAIEKQPSGKLNELYKYKTARERRSSSTVRDFFSNISNRVLRRGLSPVAPVRRRCSAGDLTDDEAMRENLTRLNTKMPKSPSNGHDISDASQQKTASPKIRFGNEELLTNNNLGNKHHRVSPTLVDVSPQNARSPTTRKGDSVNSTTSSKHRSRRESPRKFNTANSRSRTIEKHKIIKELKDANIMPASPAFEPVEMSTKRIGEAFLERKEAADKLVSRIVKRNTSKKLLQTVKIADSSHSFLEGYSADKTSDRIRRRHTAPVKASTLLKRNQPNTVAMGLKAPQYHLRERRSTTLSFKPNGTVDSLPILDHKKRRSESLGKDSCDKFSVSDEENNSSETQTLNAETLLEQKRRKEASASREAQNTPQEMPMLSLLDDVTNEINRLEKNCEVACELLRDGRSSRLSFSDIIGKNHDLKGVSSEDVPPTPPAVSPPKNENSSQTALLFASKRISNEFSSPDAVDISKPVMYLPLMDAGGQSTTVFVKSPQPTLTTEICDKKLHSATCKPAVKHGITDLTYCSKSKGPENRFVNCGEDFSNSNAIKMQLLNARSEDDIVAGPAYIPPGSRPSVLSIKSNNRGMVRQRVHHFARLEIQGAILEQNSRAAHQTQKSEDTSFKKPSAPPASHGLQSVTRKNVSPRAREIVTRQAKKFEALAVSARMDSFSKSFRPSTRSKYVKIMQKQNTPRTPRRISGEMRSTRLSQARLNKSLGKLAVSLCNRGLSGVTSKDLKSETFSSVVKFMGGEECRKTVQESGSKFLHPNNLEYADPSRISHSTNVSQIMEQSSFKSPQRRCLGHSFSISSSITARSPKIYHSSSAPRRPRNPFMDDATASNRPDSDLSWKKKYN